MSVLTYVTLGARRRARGAAVSLAARIHRSWPLPLTTTDAFQRHPVVAHGL
ncbi:hypothetical protein [Gemmatimonas groenlandica]|uniref:Uncharacterized protein n=1 Tax=Gemmatimonas groenlandica TaxID=2732249 RepID=A0A6M4IRH2_9BACT|nr:hypothetical protein [Gemmatimonas groenlandica]QJR37514.1 hypothetical protein HKW67_19345 [Gemmatimonas groenlandica]